MKLPWAESKRKQQSVALLALLTLACGARAERINQEGRILEPLPVVTAPTLFNTLQADAIVSATDRFAARSKKYALRSL